jgi:hypothetical protein
VCSFKQGLKLHIAAVTIGERLAVGLSECVYPCITILVTYLAVEVTASIIKAGVAAIFRHFLHPFSSSIPVYEHPVVLPQVSHLRQVPFLTKVKLPHSPQASPS